MASDDVGRTVLDIMTGAWRAQALYAAVALGLPDHVSVDEWTTGADVAARVAADPDAITRLMRLLTAIGVFDGDEHQGYRLTPVSALLRRDSPSFMRDMCLMYGEETYRAWGCVVDAMRTGRPGFEFAFGRSLHQYLADDPQAGPKFLRAMNAGSEFFAQVPQVYDFSGHRTVVDVGGGSGMLLSAVLSAEPAPHGVVFEREHMTAVAKEYLASTVDPARFEVVAGDLFQSVPQGADCYLLSRVLQDWDDSACTTLLTNIRRAMPSPKARLLIVERVISDDGRDQLPLLFDLQLLLMAGGRERTLAGYRSLLRRAGFLVESAHDLALGTTLLVVAPV